MGKRLNVGSGGNFLEGYDNLDKNTYFNAIPFDFDKELLTRYDDNSVDDIVCHGCLNEFDSTVVTAMNEFWRVLVPGGRVDIIVAVVDHGIGPFRDPVAKRYLSSEWVQYFLVENPHRLAGGLGLGFRGKFTALLDEVAGERHHVILEAIK